MKTNPTTDPKDELAESALWTVRAAQFVGIVFVSTGAAFAVAFIMYFWWGYLLVIAALLTSGFAIGGLIALFDRIIGKKRGF
jgi:fatty acid desaturase